MRRVPFQSDEWFHCYNRGIDKRNVFENEDDSKRFMELLYLANSTDVVHRSNLSEKSVHEILQRPRTATLTSVGAYCLMKNHYHLLLKETCDGGITQFMQKLGTAYTMYFNTKYERVGNLFLRPFRARHVGEDRYFQRVVDYIHCNPAERFEPGWKKGSVRNMQKLQRELLAYPFSSFADYTGNARPERAILSEDGFKAYHSQSPAKILDESRIYYASISGDDIFFKGTKPIKATP